MNCEYDVSSFQHQCQRRSRNVKELVSQVTAALEEIKPSNEIRHRRGIVQLCLLAYCSEGSADIVAKNTLNEINDRFFKVTKEINKIHSELYTIEVTLNKIGRELDVIKFDIEIMQHLNLITILARQNHVTFNRILDIANSGRLTQSIITNEEFERAEKILNKKLWHNRKASRLEIVTERNQYNIVILIPLDHGLKEVHYTI